tara:strand:+ start:511 stop:3177 length:2667 start_codon:yes stop_codon:yes gene_type:complete
MVKKTVKLVPQERFDLIDARALQQGTLEYIGSALGNLMGFSNGLLSELNTQIDAADRTITFTHKFAFFVTTPASETVDNVDGTGFSGEVVMYDPASPVQVTQSVDYTAVKNAKDAYFADGSLDAEQNDADVNSRLLTIGEHAPFLWARPVRIEGQLDARRKWSVAQQTEVPVTMNTRTITAVEFALSPSMPEFEAGSSPWAKIAKIIQWTGAGSNTPILFPCSAFDSRKWEDRGGNNGIGDVDLGEIGVQRDYFSNESPNLSTWNIFERYETANSPAITLVHDMLINESNWDIGNERSPLPDRTMTSRLAQLDNYLASGGTLGQAGIGIKKNAASSPWQKFNSNASNGIVDQLAALRVVIQNAVGSGVLDHGQQPDSLVSPYQSGSIANLTNVFNAVRSRFESHWSARPLRSLNSLALENICLSDETARQEGIIQDLLTRVTELERNQADLLAETDPFSEVPINSAKPIVPALSMSFDAQYYYGGSGNREFMKVRQGPAGTNTQYSFFILANAFSQISYARGGVRIRLQPEFLRSLGGSLEDCVIFATPTHKEINSPWLVPSTNVISGRVEYGGGQNFAGNPVYNQVQGFIHTPESVLNAFANFYQCTLNIVIRKKTAGDMQDIEVYPVNSVPDIVNRGHDLRGYPNYGKWIDQVGGLAPEGGNNAHYEANVQDTWRDGHRQDTANLGTTITYSTPNDLGVSTGLQDTVGATVFGYLHGDTTDPRIYRTDVQGTNFAKDEIFGHKDDLRGYCHDLTFLRPDRLFFEKTGGGEYIFGGNLAGPEHIELYPNPDTDAHAIGNSGGRPPAPNTAVNNGWYPYGINTTTANGKFVPSFSIVIYPPAFAELGNEEPVFRFTEDDVHLNYNASSVPNEDGNIIRTGDTSTRGGN